ncbi:hypothetical protein D1007_23332 [Hordeum vulgare]|nr:hypothetical protein D1007_23332 [Hordeum vulgare]
MSTMCGARPILPANTNNGNVQSVGHALRALSRCPSSSPSPSPPSPSRMIEEEEARLLQRVMEDSINTDDERQWVGPKEMMTLSVAVNEEVHKEQPVAASPPPPEMVGQRWMWSCTATEMAQGVGAEPWCPTTPQSPERESLPRGEVVHEPRAQQTFQGRRPTSGRCRRTSTSVATMTTTGDA